MKACCPGCGQVREFSAAAGACVDCLRMDRAGALARALAAHRAARRDFALPLEPPRSPGALRCLVCANECKIGPGERGFCGLRTNRAGRIHALAGSERRGLLHWYRDPLPTNCVADWVCPGRKQPGKHNLAVFYGACSFDCLFCQNWHFRKMSAQGRHVLSRLIASFDPAIPYALLAFAPQFQMHDLPRTSREHAEVALEAARAAGLTRIRLGNRHLLGTGD
jgi:pyruvate formate lyase activating enzyme